MKNSKTTAKGAKLPRSGIDGPQRSHKCHDM